METKTVAQKKTYNIRREAFLNYLSDVFFISVAILIYRNVPYYKAFLLNQTQQEMIVLGCAFLLVGFPYYIFYAGDQISKSRRIILEVINLISSKAVKKKKSKSSLPSFDPKVKVFLLFFLVKFFYLPLMINFIFYHISDIKNFGIELFYHHSDMSALYTHLYQLTFQILFLIDTLYYGFGYTVEAKILNNEVRSVEPTLLGWCVALACYPPFNEITNYFFPWVKSDMLSFGNPVLTVLFRILIVIFTGIYVWASLALGAKCSNLTNRGIVARGPYAFVRHPAYISKTLSWWIMTIPYINTKNILGAIAWGVIYYLRAITEERHLGKDPDYLEYCKKVRCRFIPYVW